MAAKTKGKRYGILLTGEGAKEVGEVLRMYIRSNQSGSYLNCTSLDPSGPLFRMTCEPNSSFQSAGEAEVQIPHRFVKLVLSSTSTNLLGFLGA